MNWIHAGIMEESECLEDFNKAFAPNGGRHVIAMISGE
jgi:hypothetical protein